MKIFILEDNPDRIRVFRDTLNVHGNSVTMCNTVAAAKAILSAEQFDVLHLDHDLDRRVYVPITEPNAGYQLALWIAKNNIPGRIIIHSHNEIAVPEMLKVLPQARWEPFEESNYICACEPNENGIRPGVVNGVCVRCGKAGRTLFEHLSRL